MCLSQLNWRITENSFKDFLNVDFFSFFLKNHGLASQVDRVPLNLFTLYFSLEIIKEDIRSRICDWKESRCAIMTRKNSLYVAQLKNHWFRSVLVPDNKDKPEIQL